MSKAKQHWSGEGRVAPWNKAERFLTSDRVKGTLSLYQWKLRKPCKNLPEDKTIWHGMLKDWLENGISLPGL